MSTPKLPIGIQDFEKIITQGFTYVDKTPLIYRLLERGSSYFLSRPRRFGKSLLISTFYALFSGRRDLFKGLWIDNSDWGWAPCPIIRLDMSGISCKSPEIFEKALIRALKRIAASYQLTLSADFPSEYLSDLIEQLALKGKVVVLIDEYDRALIDHIDETNIAIEIRNILREFYGILKVQDAHIKFIFLTGVTKFAKVSVFSGLNNLNDLTLSDDYSTLLGYTKDELTRYFSHLIQEVARKNGFTWDRCCAEIKEWYNGYKFSKNGELVYNPFSTLKLLDACNFSPHWFETGTPAFLIDLVKKRQFDLSNLEQIAVSEQSFSTFDIEELPTLPLLYQTGYLTIKSFLPAVNAYCLGFPNREVSQAFSESLLTTFACSRAECSKILVEISATLNTQPWNYSQFFNCMEKLFALIPYDLYVRREKYFHSLFYLTIKLAGFQIGAEIHTHQGRTDAVLETREKVIIFEFKLDESSQAAIDQIKEKKYYANYQEKALPLYLVGINFSGKLRAIEGWQVEQSS